MCNFNKKAHLRQRVCWAVVGLAIVGLASGVGCVFDQGGLPINGNTDGGPEPDGQPPECTDPEQCPGLDRTCAYRTCEQGSCGMENAPAGTACTEDGGQVCDGAGSCVECNDTPDCTGEICVDHQCVPATCIDGVKNEDESDVDCGGSCVPCANGLECRDPADCQSRFCDLTNPGVLEPGTCAPCTTDPDCTAVADTWCDNGVCANQKVLGDLCDGPNECLSGFCPTQDGLCCDAACDALCMACTGGKTGGTNGNCLSVTAQTDPDLECTDQGPTSCGSNGDGCDGDAVDPGCILYNASTVCSAEQCAGGMATEAGLCDGLGTCLAPLPVSCEPYVCDANGIDCLTDCNAGGAADCMVGYTCETGICVGCTHRWSYAHGDATNNQYGTGIAADAAGNVVVVGRLRGTVDVGGATLTSAGGRDDVFVAAYDASGSHVWSDNFGDGTQDQFAEDVAIDLSGNIVVVGRFKTAIDFGGGTMSSVSDKYDVFVAKWNAAGVHQWSDHFGDGTQDQFAQDVAVDSSGNIVVVGRFRGSIDFGGGAMNSTNGGKYDVFVAKFGPSGTHLWSNHYGDGANDQYAEGVAVDTNGNIVVVGRFKGAINFGGGTMNSVSNKYDIFVARLGPGGGYVWSDSFGEGSQDQYGTAVATDPLNNFFVVGQIRGIIPFSATVTLTSAGGNRDVFIAKFSAPGVLQWADNFGDGTQDQFVESVATTASGAVVFVGRARSSIDFGGGVLTSAGGHHDVYWAKLSGSGAHLCSAIYGDGNSEQYAQDVAVDSSGNTLVTGRITGNVSLGGAVLPAPSEYHFFRVKYSP